MTSPDEPSPPTPDVEPEPVPPGLPDGALDAGPVDAGPGDAGPGDGAVDAGAQPSVDDGPVDDGPVDGGPVDDGEDQRWVSLAATLGLLLAAIVTAQTIGAVIEGMSLRPREPHGAPVDFLHQLGYPFGNLGPATLLTLIAALVLVSIPPLAGRQTTDRQELAAAVTLGLAVVTSLLLVVGSVLAARYTWHYTTLRYAAQQRSVPPFIRVEVASSMFTALAMSLVAFFGSLAAMRVRDPLPAYGAADAGGDQD